MTVRQLAEASCTLACFESFLGQNGIRITQREMKKMRPDICGEVDDEARCVYTHHYAAQLDKLLDSRVPKSQALTSYSLAIQPRQY